MTKKNATKQTNAKKSFKSSINELFIYYFYSALKSTRNKIPENVISGNCSVNQKSKYQIV